MSLLEPRAYPNQLRKHLYLYRLLKVKWHTGESPVKVANLNKNMSNIKTGKQNTLLFMSKGRLINQAWENHRVGDGFRTPGTEAYRIVNRHYHGKKVQSLYSENMWNVGNGEVHIFSSYKTKGQAKAFNPTGTTEDFPN